MQDTILRLVSLFVFILAATELTAHEQDWGVSAVIRRASVPYDSANGADSVSTFIPMLHVENQSAIDIENRY